jgi:hypothetical protein
VSRLALALLLLSTVAGADGILVQGDFPKLKVDVGQTVEAAVGHYRGQWGCDDATLVTADIITRGDTNYWIVKGVKAGSTQCRVGMVSTDGFAMFDVYVSEPKKK